MKIISWNVNGLRSVYKKGFIDWFIKENADIVCLQEVKINQESLDNFLSCPEGYYCYTNLANKKGYSGVLVYTKLKPIKVNHQLGLDRFDTEGRLLELKYPNFNLINLYIPHGGRSKENLVYKLEVYKKLLTKYPKSSEKRIIVGDFNIAHQEIDLARPAQNKDNIMFTPNERTQIDYLLKQGFIDSFRNMHPQGGNYSWWPYMANARQRNLCWRIDYCFVSKNLVSKVKDVFILPGVNGSDHCPIELTIDI